MAAVPFTYRFLPGTQIRVGTRSYRIVNQTTQNERRWPDEFVQTWPAYRLERVGHPNDVFVISSSVVDEDAVLEPAAQGRNTRRRKLQKLNKQRRKNNRSKRKLV